MRTLLGDHLWQSLRDWWSQSLGLNPVILGPILNSLAILVLFFAVRRLTLWLVNRRVNDVTRRYHIDKAIEYSYGLLAVLAIAYVWLTEEVNFGTFLGLTAAGLAIALQEPITNLAGWLFLLIRQPFKVGDRIQVGKDFAGDVIDMRLFMFSVLEIGNWVDADQSTGRILHIPNNVVFRQVLANYTQGFHYIWAEMPVTVTFESDWRKAKKILEDVAHETVEQFSAEAQEKIKDAAKQFMIFYNKLTPIVWVRVIDYGVTLTIRYMVRVRHRRGIETELWSKILAAFVKEKDIDFAYPTQRFYQNPAEGKPGTGGPPEEGPTQPKEPAQP